MLTEGRDTSQTKEVCLQGLQPTDKKVEAIRTAPAPTDLSQLKSFLGLINYYSKFLPNLSHTYFVSLVQVAAEADAVEVGFRAAEGLRDHQGTTLSLRSRARPL